VFLRRPLFLSINVLYTTLVHLLDRQVPGLCFSVFLLDFLRVIITAIFGLASAVDCLTSPTGDVRPNTGTTSDGAFG
jgi:hypothetical protein